jgi:predicted alpha/beta superfamily hydrolase
MSYGDTEKTYPVLWITDNNLEAALAAFGPLELILVCVGSGQVSLREWDFRRVYEFSPTEDLYFDGPGGDWLRQEMPSLFPGSQNLRLGGAGRFLDFLIDDVRPALSADYRMSDDHGLLGFSSGGLFVAFSLFARPGAFSRYICGSPPLYNCNYAVFDLEQEYARTHKDLPAHVFFGAGEAELVEPRIAAYGAVSSMMRMAETLSFRSYPALQMTVKIFPGESHLTMLPPLISWGVRAVWGDEIAYTG